jgi:hypothetical protein
LIATRIAQVEPQQRIPRLVTQQCLEAPGCVVGPAAQCERGRMPQLIGAIVGLLGAGECVCLAGVLAATAPRVGIGRPWDAGRSGSASSGKRQRVVQKFSRPPRSISTPANATSRTGAGA